MKHLLLVVALTLTVGCASHLPPNLSPEATHAWYGTQIIKGLDHVRDAADDAHKTTPPLIDAKTELTVVNWHQTAINIVNNAQAGWKDALAASVTGLQRNLPAGTWRLIQPYVQLVLNIVKEVQ